MSKLVEIEKCEDCLHFDNEYYDYNRECCRLNRTIPIQRMWAFPDDCPLPNAPEGAHCADTPKTE